MTLSLSLSSPFHCVFDLTYHHHCGEEKEEGKGGEEGGRKKGQKEENKCIQALSTRVLTTFFKKSFWPVLHRHLYFLL